MGRRAKKAPVQTKKRPTLAKTFKCPFCANEGAVECKMDKRAGVGSLNCRLCSADFQMPIHHLHEPIDVFSEWLDDCEREQTQQTTQEEQHTLQYEEEQDEDLGEASGLTRTSAQQGEPKSSAEKTATEQQQATSYATLGLDDSDDDDSV